MTDLQTINHPMTPDAANAFVRGRTTEQVIADTNAMVELSNSQESLLSMRNVLIALSDRFERKAARREVKRAKAQEAE